MKSLVVTQSTLLKLRENTVEATGLHHFDLSNATAGPRDVKAIADAIKLNYQTYEGMAPLVSIDLQGNQLCGIDSMAEGTYDHNGLKDFCSTIVNMSKMSRLRKLNLSRNFLDTDGLSSVAHMIANGPSSIVDLNIKNCGGIPESMGKIADSLRSNKSLLTLDLSQNEIGAAGAQAIERALQQNTRLKQLILNECNLGSEGSVAIFRGLYSNNYLQVLSIAENYMGDSGAEACASMLAKNNSLANLDLQENHISDEGISMIARSLAKNDKISFLGLQWNDISNEGAAYIAEALASNRTLKALFILGNHIDKMGLSAIVDASLANGSGVGRGGIECDMGFALNR